MYLDFLVRKVDLLMAADLSRSHHLPVSLLLYCQALYPTSMALHHNPELNQPGLIMGDRLAGLAVGQPNQSRIRSTMDPLTVLLQHLSSNLDHRLDILPPLLSVLRDLQIRVP